MRTIVCILNYRTLTPFKIQELVWGQGSDLYRFTFHVQAVVPVIYIGETNRHLATRIREHSFH